MAATLTPRAAAMMSPVEKRNYQRNLLAAAELSKIEHEGKTATCRTRIYTAEEEGLRILRGGPGLPRLPAEEEPALAFNCSQMHKLGRDNWNISEMMFLHFWEPLQDVVIEAARSPSQSVSENCGVGKYFFYPIVETLP